MLKKKHLHPISAWSSELGPNSSMVVTGVEMVGGVGHLLLSPLLLGSSLPSVCMWKDLPPTDNPREIIPYTSMWKIRFFLFDLAVLTSFFVQMLRLGFALRLSMTSSAFVHFYPIKIFRCLLLSRLKLCCAIVFIYNLVSGSNRLLER